MAAQNRGVVTAQCPVLRSLPAFSGAMPKMAVIARVSGQSGASDCHRHPFPRSSPAKLAGWQRRVCPLVATLWFSGAHARYSRRVFALFKIAISPFPQPSDTIMRGKGKLPSQSYSDPSLSGLPPFPSMSGRLPPLIWAPGPAHRPAELTPVHPPPTHTSPVRRLMPTQNETPFEMAFSICPAFLLYSRCWSRT